MNNSLTNIDLLRDLKHLQWLNVSGNEIKVKRLFLFKELSLRFIFW